MNWPWQTESEEDRASRGNLLLFFSVTRLALQTLFDRLGQRPPLKDQPMIKRLNTIRVHAFANVEDVLQRLTKPLRRGVRKKFEELGLWNGELFAKLEMLWECIKNDVLTPILATINLILGSMKKASGPYGILADVMEEFKKMMEIVVDGLEEDPLISLNLPAPPPLQPV